MNNYVILTDSSCDLSKELATELGVSMLSLEILFEDGTTKRNDEVDVKEFYQKLRGKQKITTSAVSIERFSNFFEPYLAAGTDVLYLGFSSGLSGTFNAGFVASNELAEKYPDRKILTVDTLCASAGQGLLVYFAVQKKNSGATIEEVAQFVEDTRLNICHWFSVDDLVYLKRGGRISPALAFVGGLLGIKPVLHVDDEGKLVSVSKVRGRKSALSAIADQFGELAQNKSGGTVYISHGDCLNDVKILEEMLSTRYGVKVDIITDVGTVIGAHSGPGTIALFFIGKNR